MKARKQTGLLAASIAVATLLLQAACFAEQPRAVMSADISSATAAIRAARLPEPLVATAPTTPAEDLALAHALMAYGQRGRPDDTTSLTDFLSRFPHSGWAPALLTNLGLTYLHHGYFSRALDA
jgi:hypothetical protein